MPYNGKYIRRVLLKFYTLIIFFQLSFLNSDLILNFSLQQPAIILLFLRLMTHSDCLKEVDLEHNLIGDLGGREILEALMDRKEGEISLDIYFLIRYTTLIITFDCPTKLLTPACLTVRQA
jgi:hypothetical protein